MEALQGQWPQEDWGLGFDTESFEVVDTHCRSLVCKIEYLIFIFSEVFLFSKATL